MPAPFQSAVCVLIRWYISRVAGQMNEGHVGMTYMSSGNRMAALMKAAPGDIKAQQQVCPSLCIIPLGPPPPRFGGGAATIL